MGVSGRRRICAIGQLLITGFGNLITEGVKKTVDTDVSLGILTGGLTVGAAGITADLIFGLIASFFAKSTDKTD